MVSQKDRDEQEKTARGELLTLIHKIKKLIEADLEGQAKQAARKQLATHIEGYRARYRTLCELMGHKIASKKSWQHQS